MHLPFSEILVLDGPPMWKERTATRPLVSALRVLVAPPVSEVQAPARLSVSALQLQYALHNLEELLPPRSWWSCATGP